MPLTWVGAPRLVLNWIKQIKAKGKKTEGKIVFSMYAITKFLKENGVPHVAVFLKKNVKNNVLEFAESDCIEQKN